MESLGVSLLQPDILSLLVDGDLAVTVAVAVVVVVVQVKK